MRTAPFSWHRRAWRRLLQLDEPVPPCGEADGAAATPAEAEAERDQHYRWNFTVNLLDGATFWFGASFASSSTIVPLFISKLSESPFPVGLAAVIAQGAWYLPQLFTAPAVERLTRKKPVVVNLGFFLERLPMWFLVIAALLAGHSPGLALALFLAAYAWHGLGAGIVATAWQDLIARCFPVERRGRFLGLTTFLGTGMGALGAALSAWLLATYPFPTSFVYTFSVAAGAISASWFFLALTREPVQPVAPPAADTPSFWAELPAILRRDHNFRRFLLARLLLALGAMGLGFVTVAAVRRWQVPDSTVAGYTAALLLGQTAGTISFGLLADRFGHKLALELSALAAGLAFLLAWQAPGPQWYTLVFALLGVYLGAIIVSGILVVLEFSPPARRPTYVGLANTSVGVVATLGPLLGAALAAASYGALFALSALLNLLALMLLRWWVREPRRTAAAATVRKGKSVV